ncbi:MAG TPA: TetR/AcrR family transcriptional regulator [Deltaproteobacteria bacterium]|nr:TetR/AcrR family transcriptional regulator [Deltaproteobacteria bacterium]HOI06619.1 TetR/AcrR family transcriptional regulator [Deltaproteobacteria bacterium]
MPKAARSQEDRELIREKILEEALTLISEHGFTAFSMRKLASRLGLSATTIYNYYSSKDELYLMILTRGFEMLHQRFEEILLSPGDPARKLRDMVRAYIDFGINKAHYYNIMFTSDAPKYRDYIGTDIEPVAYVEKQNALKLIDVTTRAFQEYIHATGFVPKEEIRYSIIKLWSTLHGIIALYNSRVLPEVDENPDRIVEHMAQEILTPILSDEAGNRAPDSG